MTFEFNQVVAEFMDLDVNPCALLLFCESQHFIGAFIRPLGRFYRRSTTDKRALESCATLLYGQAVYEMCKLRVCIHNILRLALHSCHLPFTAILSIHIKAVLQKV